MVRVTAASQKQDPLDRPASRLITAARWAGLWLLIFAAILIPFFLFEEPLGRWTATALQQARGNPLLGATILIALLGGDAVLPVPSSIVSTLAGTIFGWRMGTLVIWVGMTLGCLVSYALGCVAAHGPAERLVGKGQLDSARKLFAEIGPAALIITRAVPVIGEAATLVAGAARMPFSPFIVATSIANLGIAFAYAGIGATAMSANSFLIGFTGLVSVPAIGWAAWRFSHGRLRPEVV